MTASRTNALLSLILLVPVIAVAAPASALPGPDGKESSTDRRILVSFAYQKAINPWRISAQRSYAGSSRWRVSLHQRRQTQEFGKRHGLNFIQDWPVPSIDLYCAVFRLRAGSNLPEMLTRVRRDSSVVTAEPLRHYNLLASPSPNDPLYSLQYGDQVETIDALHRFADGDGIKVGLVDTYVDGSHPDLRGQVRRNRSFLGPDSARSAEHGTAMAGIIAARRDNGTGIVGFAPGARVHAYESCGRIGGRLACGSFALAQALEQAIEDRVDIINLSLSGPYDPLLARLLYRAHRGGTTLVAARDPEQPDGGFPANMEPVQSANDNPAHAIWFTALERFSLQAGGGYQYYYGSSVAAASISGIAALLRQVLSGSDIESLLHQVLLDGCVSRQLPHINLVAPAVHGCRAKPSSRLPDGHPA